MSAETIFGLGQWISNRLVSVEQLTLPLCIVSARLQVADRYIHASGQGRCNGMDSEAMFVSQLSSWS